MTSNSVRYFGATKETLRYLIEEQYEEENAAALQEAIELVEQAEENLFDAKKCEQCGRIVKAVGEDSAKQALKKHEKGLHR